MIAGFSFDAKTPFYAPISNKKVRISVRQFPIIGNAPNFTYQFDYQFFHSFNILTKANCRLSFVSLLML
jgi:hypothetical protein